MTSTLPRGPRPGDDRTGEPRLAIRRGRPLGRMILATVTTTDHKQIGYLYLVSSFGFFLLAGLMALVIRAELWAPGLQVVQTRQFYNQMFTMHGTVMLLFFATPAFAGVTNAVMPLQIGAPDVAFPRLNALSFWMFLFGGLIAMSGFLTPYGAADFGWYAYAPLSIEGSPQLGGSLWVVGLALSGVGTILGAVNFITTIVCLRAPGMTMWRMPIFTWNALLTSVLVLFAFPILAAALFGMLLDRTLDAHIFDPETYGPVLWQHLFWFFGHPEVYIVALPFFGIITEVIPVFSRKPIFGYRSLVFATIAITGLSVTVWAHHMFASGQVALPFFSFLTMLIAVPTGVKVFNWIATMWRGAVTLDAAMMYAVGFLLTFVLGGITGVILGSPPLDFHVTDSYFVVAHFHYVLFGTVVFALFAGFHFWWPKWTGRMLDERLGIVSFWFLFIGFHTTFLIQHWLGIDGMPRRYADYLPEDGFQLDNQISTIGSLLLTVSVLVFLANVLKTQLGPRTVFLDDPWGFGRSLEWATSCPPPRHNFVELPRIRSQAPAFELHHPEAAEATRVPAHPPAHPPDSPLPLAYREAEKHPDDE